MRKPNRIRELREGRGLTQAELAKLLEVEESTVYMWERGEKEPSPEQMRNLRRVLKLKSYYELYVNPEQATTADTA